MLVFPPRNMIYVSLRIIVVCCSAFESYRDGVEIIFLHQTSERERRAGSELNGRWTCNYGPLESYNNITSREPQRETLQKQQSSRSVYRAGLFFRRECLWSR